MATGRESTIGAEAIRPDGSSVGGPVATAATWIVLAGWLTFAFAHGLTRLTFDLTLSPADSLDLVAAQELHLMYQAAQPPLFTWLVWFVAQITGPVPLAIQIVKYGLMLAAGWLAYLAGREATGRRDTALIGSFAILLPFNVGITIHDQSTHSVALIAAMCALIYAAARLVRRGDAVAYLALALALISGILSKHSFIILAAALIAAMAADPAARRLLLDRRFAVVIAVVMVALAPFALWMLDNRTDAAASLARTIHERPDRNAVIAIGRGLVMLAGGIAALVLPVAVLLALCFPGLSRRFKALVERTPASATATAAHPPARFVQILGRATWLVVAILAIAVVASQAGNVPSRHLLIIALPATLYIAWLIGADAADRRNASRFAVLILAIQIALVATRVATYAFPGPPFCDKCNHVRPVREMAEALTRRGFANATIATDDRTLAANLLRYLPTARILALELPRHNAPQPTSSAQSATCIFLTEATDLAQVASAQDALSRATIRLERAADLKPPFETWQLIQLPPGHPNCRLG